MALWLSTSDIIAIFTHVFKTIVFKHNFHYYLLLFVAPPVCYSEVETSNRVNGVQSPAVVSPSYLYSEVLPRSQRVLPSPAAGVRAAASADHLDAQV